MEGEWGVLALTILKTPLLLVRTQSIPYFSSLSDALLTLWLMIQCLAQNHVTVQVPALHGLALDWAIRLVE